MGISIKANSSYKKTAGLKLYHTEFCPYCQKVRAAMKELNLNIELRDINLNKDWEKELVSHGGKRQTPCLCIDENESQRWMYESNDIISYLKNLPS